MTAMIAVMVGALVLSAMFAMGIAQFHSDNLRLRDENRRLREWQGAQGKTPELGAYRAQDIPRSADAVLCGATEERARRMCGYCFVTEAENCAHLPAPTSVPSSGTEVES